MAKKKTRTQSQATHHKRLILMTKELLTYLSDTDGTLWKDVDINWPRGMGKTGLKFQLRRISKQIKQPYN